VIEVPNSLAGARSFVHGDQFSKRPSYPRRPKRPEVLGAAGPTGYVRHPKLVRQRAFRPTIFGC